MSGGKRLHVSFERGVGHKRDRSLERLFQAVSLAVSLPDVEIVSPHTILNAGPSYKVLCFSLDS